MGWNAGERTQVCSEHEDSPCINTADDGCTCKNALGASVCIGEKLWNVWWPRSTNYYSAKYENISNSTWSVKKISPEHLWADCKKLDDRFDMKGKSPWRPDGMPQGNNTHFRAKDCSGRPDMSGPVIRWFSNSSCSGPGSVIHIEEPAFKCLREDVAKPRILRGQCCVRHFTTSSPMKDCNSANVRKR